MPHIGSTSDLTIVAHTDDDLLFMNPDIQEGISAGREVTTVYLTAGDAGQGEAYWLAREAGIKAAYGHMAGADDWVDEITTITQGGVSFEVATSHLAAAPEIKLYFLRLPDGGRPGEGSHDFDSLTKLLEGEIDSLDTMDGAASYSEAELELVLTGILEQHQPEQIRVHDNDSRHAEIEHVDHLATAELSDRALEHYSADNYTVTSYVNYATRDLRANLAEDDALAGLETFLEYAAYDPYVFDTAGEVILPFAEWPARQYIADEYSVTDGTQASVSGSYYVEGEDTEAGDLALEGARVVLMDIAGGDVIAETVTDADGTYVFANVPAGDGYAVLVEPPESLSPDLSGRALTTAQSYDSAAEFETFVEIDSFAIVEGQQISGVDAAVAATDGGYALEGPDAAFFDVSADGETILLQGWFQPNALDPWDDNGDNVYEIERVQTGEGGEEIGREALRIEVMPDSMIVVVPVETDPIFLSAAESQERIAEAEEEEELLEDLFA